MGNKLPSMRNALALIDADPWLAPRSVALIRNTLHYGPHIDSRLSHRECIANMLALSSVDLVAEAIEALKRWFSHLFLSLA